jgi:hypothetical protein
LRLDGRHQKAIGRNKSLVSERLHWINAGRANGRHGTREKRHRDPDDANAQVRRRLGPLYPSLHRCEGSRERNREYFANRHHRCRICSSFEHEHGEAAGELAPEGAIKMRLRRFPYIAHCRIAHDTGYGHQLRLIGSVYPEGTPDAFIGDIVAADAFDAVLFVEATTVARKNPGR